MAKFYGAIGYSVSTETSPGVWEDVVTERKYVGDIVTNTWRWSQTDNVNPDVEVSDIVSVVADEFATANRHAIKYVKRFGRKWLVNSTTIDRPRLILNLGGPYRG